MAIKMFFRILMVSILGLGTSLEAYAIQKKETKVSLSKKKKSKKKVAKSNETPSIITWDYILAFNKNKPTDFEVPLKAENYIPINLEPTTDGDVVFRKIADRSINYWLNDPRIKNSSMARTANAVQNTMSADMAISSNQPHGISHKFKLQYLAFQNIAKIDYSGLMNASLRYYSHLARTEFEVLKKLAPHRNLIFNQAHTEQENFSKVSLQWQW
jgi:hypothetical protein